MLEEWRFAFASSIGTSHITSGTPCQDSGGVRLVGDTAILVASDGAGSAAKSHYGSALACRTALDAIEELVRTDGLRAVSREFATNLVEQIRTSLADSAAEAGDVLGDYACTLLVAVVGPQNAAYFQIGDGVIVVSVENEPGEFGWVFWPDRGEYANVTTFITSERAREELVFDAASHSIAEVAVLTDGIQSMVLDYKNQAAHSPFFERIIRPVRAAVRTQDELNQRLAEYLGSPKVNERTDDDKTLLLATRRR
jgi:hypothetical protein